jgi:predicted P-loop ATPase
MTARLLLVASLRAAEAARILLPLYQPEVWIGGGVDLTPYKGADVLVWPDATPEAPEWGEGVRAALATAPERLRVLDVSDHSGGWDAESARDEGWLTDDTVAWCRRRLNGTHPAEPEPAPTVAEAPPPPPPPDPEPARPPRKPKKERPPGITLVQGGPEQQPDLDLPASFMKWEQLGLELNGRGVPQWNVDNCERALQKHPLTSGRFWWDEFHCKVFTTWGAGQGDQTIIPRELSDVDPVAIALFLQRKCGMFGMTDLTIKKTILRIASEDIRCEPKQWMDTLAWDGQERLLDFLPRYIGTPVSDYHQKAGRNFFRGMVARVYHPGCKMDNVLVLQGKQGIKKSTALSVVGGAWYAEGHESIGSKDFYLTLHGKLLVEIAEMETFSRAEIAKVKQVITCQTDRYRTPYGALAVDYPRRNVFVGSTNEDAFLRDPTGARRFWPVYCGTIDIAGLKRDREQLFAEAVAEFKRGEGWWDMPEQETLEMQSDRQEVDDWEPLVRRYLAMEEHDGAWQERYTPLTVISTAQLLGHAVNKPAGQWTKFDQSRMAAIMRRLAWKRTKMEDGTHSYLKPEY